MTGARIAWSVFVRGSDGEPVGSMRTRVTVRKGTVRDRVVMKSAARISPTDRDRAVRRLRAITIGTSLAGVAAVGAFGAIAAASYDGTTTDVTTAAVTTTSTSTTDGTSSTTSSGTSTTSGTTSTTSTSLQTTTTPTTTSGTAHATTGGS
jgi:hypothetical protein